MFTISLITCTVVLLVSASVATVISELKFTSHQNIFAGHLANGNAFSIELISYINVNTFRKG